MVDLDAWRPSCSTQMLLVRAEMLKAIRQLFQDHGYLEVETPCLSRDVVLDAWLEPFEVHVKGERWFLQTSPEAHMKRLLAADLGSIFQFSRVFRNGERGKRHNPEFTMLEWYGVGTDWLQQIELTEAIVRMALDAAAKVTGRNVADRWKKSAFRRTTYAAAFQQAFGIDVFDCTTPQLLDAARNAQIALPPGLSPDRGDEILNVMLAIAIEPNLGGGVPGGWIWPEFLCDYPPSQAALAVVSEAPVPVARRFELYVEGMELCNGYQELTDAAELERREAIEKLRRTSDISETLPGAKRLAAAMSSGLPPCSGVALGFDRLVMVATERRDIQEVMPFPVERA